MKHYRRANRIERLTGQRPRKRWKRPGKRIQHPARGLPT